MGICTWVTWIYLGNLGILGYTWEYLGILGYTWVYLGIPGYTWEYLGILGILSIKHLQKQVDFQPL